MLPYENIIILLLLNIFTYNNADQTLLYCMASTKEVRDIVQFVLDDIDENDFNGIVKVSRDCAYMCNDRRNLDSELVALKRKIICSIILNSVKGKADIDRYCNAILYLINASLKNNEYAQKFIPSLNDFGLK